MYVFVANQKTKTETARREVASGHQVQAGKKQSQMRKQIKQGVLKRELQSLNTQVQAAKQQIISVDANKYNDHLINFFAENHKIQKYYQHLPSSEMSQTKLHNQKRANSSHKIQYVSQDLLMKCTPSIPNLWSQPPFFVVLNLLSQFKTNRALGNEIPPLPFFFRVSTCNDDVLKGKRKEEKV